MSATFASMRYVNYRYWFVASLIASTGVWLQRVAQDWYVLTILTDHDASQVGVVTALSSFPPSCSPRGRGSSRTASRGAACCSARRSALASCPSSSALLS